MHPVLFNIPLPFGGSLPVHAYGFMLMLAFLAGIGLTLRRAPAASIPSQAVWDISLYALISGVLGARAAFLAFYYEADPASEHPILDLISIWKGGLVFQGGLLAALAVCLWFLYAHRLPFAKVADAFAPGVAVGIALGRIGCFLNGCCWGRICAADYHLGVAFPAYHTPGVPSAILLRHWEAWRGDRLVPLLEQNGYRDLAAAARSCDPFADSMPEFLAQIHIHPTQLYICASMFVIYLLLLLVERLPRRFDGLVMLAFLMFESAARFTIDFWRDDSDPYFAWGAFPGLRISQLTAILIFLAAAGITLYRWRRTAGLKS